MKIINQFIILSTLIFSLQMQAASMIWEGSYRFNASYNSNLDVDEQDGTLAGTDTGLLFDHRLLLQPSLYIDESIRIKTEMLIFGHAGTGLVPDNYGSPLGSSDQSIKVRQAYLEWNSAYGVLRLGRQAKSWGLGLLYHPGDSVWQSFQSIADRVGFQAMIGNIGMNVAYEKNQNTAYNVTRNDDYEVFEASVDYTNPEISLDVGLLYSHIKKSSAANGDEFYLDNNADIFSIFARKAWGFFDIGVELSTINESKMEDKVGALVQMDFTFKPVTFGLDFAYASGGDDVSNVSDGTFLFSANYKPFMLLFRHSLSDHANNSAVFGGVDGFNGGRVGSSQQAEAAAMGNGAMLLKANVEYSFLQGKYVAGTNFGYAQYAEKQNNASEELGFEFDLYMNHQVRKNLSLRYAAGILLPGDAFKATAPSGDVKEVWAVEVGAALSF